MYVCMYVCAYVHVCVYIYMYVCILISSQTCLTAQVATFSPEIKDKPASVKMFVYPNLSEPVSSKTMFRASDAIFYWSPTGSQIMKILSFFLS